MTHITIFLIIISFRNGVYPLTAFAAVVPGQMSRTRAVSPEVSESVKSETPEPIDNEMRLINSMTCQVKPKTEEDRDLLQVRYYATKILLLYIV